MKLFMLILASLWSMETLSWAQAAGSTVIVNNGNFFMALVAGVLLAISFQMVLTILSMACGVSMVGNIQEKFNTPRGAPVTGAQKHPLLKAVNMVGLWTVVMTSISLFFASKLAIRIGMIADSQTAVALGLTIWATVFIIMGYLEMKSAGFILGGILNTVFSGIRSSAKMVKEIFGKSQAEKTIDTIRSEFIQTLYDPHLKSSLNGYLRQLKPPELDWGKARKELIKLLGEMELKVSDKEGGLERDAFVVVAQKHSHLSKEDVAKLGDLFDEVKNTVKNVEEDSGKIKEKVVNYLKNSGIEVLNPENLKADLNKIVSDPKSTKSVVLNRIKQFDHPTIVSIVSKANMSEEKTNQVVEKVEKVLESIKEKVEDTGKGSGVKEAMESKLRSYFSSLQRPEFDYDKIKSDIEDIFHDPKASLEILRSRLRTYDRQSLITLIDSIPHVSRQNAELIIGKIEEAKESILRKAQQIEERVKEKVHEAKETALYQAEQARRTVVISAWWIFATAVLSGYAAALGSLRALL